MAAALQEKEDKMREERWQDCLRIMDEVVSACIIEFNISKAGNLKSGSALVRRLIELLGSTEFPLNDDTFMNRAVEHLEDEKERLAIHKEQHLSQAEFMRLRRLRLLGIITAEQERNPDGVKKKKSKIVDKDVSEIDKVKEWEQNVKSAHDSEDVQRLIAQMQGMSAEDISKMVADLTTEEEESRSRPGEHPLLREFDKCQTAKGLYEVAAKMIILK